MGTLPQEGDLRIVRLKTHRRRQRSPQHHPLIKILARGVKLMQVNKVGYG
jgi:hypothetical protein